MRLKPQRLDCMTESEMDAIIEYAIRILDEVGMKIENTQMCEHLAAHGLTWDREFGDRKSVV
jgi:trimethylamine:corrinoid methyltransferase-like protein